jgi:hypothetical protein
VKRRATIGSVAAMLVLAVLILVGRHEQSVWRAKENRGIAEVRTAVGSKLTKPEAFRESLHFTCLLYSRDTHANGLELCFASTGAIVEAIERAPGINPKIWTLRSDPGASTVRENPVVIAHALDRLGAQTGPAIQVGGLDIGPEAPVAPST